MLIAAKASDIVRMFGLDPSRVKDATLFMDAKEVTLTVVYIADKDATTEMTQRYRVVEAE